LAHQVTKKYWPRQFEEMAEDPIPVSLINEPVPADNIRTLVRPSKRPLHAVLCEENAGRGAAFGNKLADLTGSSPGACFDANAKLGRVVRFTIARTIRRGCPTMGSDPLQA
jgi:hypothetical protein